MSSFIRLAVVGCLPKSQNPAKFRQNLTLEQFKVIQGKSFLVPIESPSTTSY